MAGFSRVGDYIMCPLCFDYNHKDSGHFSTVQGQKYDVCIWCAADEFLISLSMMCA